MTHGSVSFAWPGVKMITNNTKAFPPRTAVVSAVDGEKKKQVPLWVVFSTSCVLVDDMFFFSAFIAFINNSKIITGKQLAVILIFIHRSSFFL